MKRSESIVRAVLVVLFGYLLALGGTFTGVVTPEFSSITLALMALLTFVWLLAHWRGGWRWYSTPLDAVFVLWGIAFIASIVANNETWRRSTIALWYMGLYMGVWYALNDILTNRAAKRETVIDALFFAGLIVLLFGYFQLANSIGGILPRPVSTLGNPNFLGAFLVILTPLALGRLVSVGNRVGRSALGLYTLASVGLLLLTGSRGAWLGLATSLAVWSLLTLAHSDLLSPTKLIIWWRSQLGRIRALVAELQESPQPAFSFYVRSLSQAVMLACALISITPHSPYFLKARSLGEVCLPSGIISVALVQYHPCRRTHMPIMRRCILLLNWVSSA
jgi:hypothetical protein